MALLAVAGCYSPTVVRGAPCDLSTNNCPSGQTCVASGAGAFCTGGGSGSGSGVDSGTGDGMACLGTHLIGGVCLSKPPTAPVTLSAGTINTASVAAGQCTEIRAQSGGPSLCVIAGTTISVPSGTIRAIGPNPLVLYATQTITIDGVVDASSHAGETVGGQPVVGAGARLATDCGVIGADGTQGKLMNSNYYGGGGAAGGTFGTAGGAGGAGGKGNIARGNPGVVGAAPALLFGGCPGGKGGDGIKDRKSVV